MLIDTLSSLIFIICPLNNNKKIAAEQNILWKVGINTFFWNKRNSRFSANFYEFHRIFNFSFKCCIFALFLLVFRDSHHLRPFAPLLPVLKLIFCFFLLFAIFIRCILFRTTTSYSVTFTDFFTIVYRILSYPWNYCHFRLPRKDWISTKCIILLVMPLKCFAPKSFIKMLICCKSSPLKANSNLQFARR